MAQREPQQMPTTVVLQFADLASLNPGVCVTVTDSDSQEIGAIKKTLVVKRIGFVFLGITLQCVCYSILQLTVLRCVCVS